MIVIDQQANKEMIADATQAYPDECCGFLFGNSERDVQTVALIKAVMNSKEGDRRRRFLIAPKDYLAAERFAEESKLDLIGIYHSHPDHPAIPSEHDRIAAQPNFSYIILSVKNGQFDHISSWRLDEEQQFEQETISNNQLIK